MSAIKAIYENGVFRPLHPVKLPDGAPVDLIIVNEPIPNSQTPVVNNDSGDEPGPLVGEELVALLDQIAALPYSPHPDGRTDVAEHHDEFLYPKHGKQP